MPFKKRSDLRKLNKNFYKDFFHSVEQGKRIIPEIKLTDISNLDKIHKLIKDHGAVVYKTPSPVYSHDKMSENIILTKGLKELPHGGLSYHYHEEDPQNNPSMVRL